MPLTLPPQWPLTQEIFSGWVSHGRNSRYLRRKRFYSERQGRKRLVNDRNQCTQTPEVGINSRGSEASCGRRRQLRKRVYPFRRNRLCGAGSRRSVETQRGDSAQSGGPSGKPEVNHLFSRWSSN